MIMRPTAYFLHWVFIFKCKNFPRLYWKKETSKTEHPDGEWNGNKKMMCGFYVQINLRHIFYFSFTFVFFSVVFINVNIMDFFFLFLFFKRTGILFSNRLLRSRWSITRSIDTTIYSVLNSCQWKRTSRLDSSIKSW